MIVYIGENKMKIKPLEISHYSGMDSGQGVINMG
jgi:hypothetical protein